MEKFSPDSIDLVVTSPPYWGLRDYGSETIRVWGDDPECKHEWVEDSTIFGNMGGGEEGRKEVWDSNMRDKLPQRSFCYNCGAWRGSLGLEPHPQMFIDHLVEICREIRRVLKSSGTFWLNLGDTYYGSGGKGGQYEKFMPDKGQPDHYRQSSKTRSNWLQPKQKLMIPSRVAIALQHDGWILRSDIIWHKPNHMPSSVKDRLTCAYEHVFLFAKARRYYFDLDAIRQPHKVAKIRFPDRKIDYKHKDGPELRGLSGSASRQYFQTETATAWNPLGKNPGDVWEIEEKNLTKHDRTVGRINRSYTDPLHKKEYNIKGKNPGDLWRIPTTPFPGAHFATFPPKLIAPIIKAGSPKGGIVLDPFGGSGTVGQVARRLGRRFILIEIIPGYCKMAEQRVRGRYKPTPPGVVPLDQFMEAEK